LSCKTDCVKKAAAEITPERVFFRLRCAGPNGGQ
jgi:hypothetical protein